MDHTCSLNVPKKKFRLAGWPPARKFRDHRQFENPPNAPQSVPSQKFLRRKEERPRPTKFLRMARIPRRRVLRLPRVRPLALFAAGLASRTNTLELTSVLPPTHSPADRDPFHSGAKPRTLMLSRKCFCPRRDHHHRPDSKRRHCRLMNAGERGSRPGARQRGKYPAETIAPVVMRQGVFDGYSFREWMDLHAAKTAVVEQRANRIWIQKPQMLANIMKPMPAHETP